MYITIYYYLSNDNVTGNVTGNITGNNTGNLPVNLFLLYLDSFKIGINCGIIKQNHAKQTPYHKRHR